MFRNRARIRFAGFAGFAAFAAIGLLLASATGASAQTDNITITKHNFSTASSRDGTFFDLQAAGVADYGEICVYCHTPHGGQTNAPLWNRTYQPGTFTMYQDVTGGSSELDMTFAAQPTGVSLACLSCHDGTIGIDVIINPPNASAATPGVGTDLQTLFGASAPDSFKVLGTDLRNDHPISMVYSSSDDPAFNPIASVQGVLKLFSDPSIGTGSDVVQCATCHNPHSPNPTFLRIVNDGSALCLTCHIK